MAKATYQEKITALDHALASDIPDGMKEVLREIKLEVEKTASKRAKTSSEPGSSVPGAASKQDNTLYNKCMGRYREFLKARGSFLDMNGRKAYFVSQAMRQILAYLENFMRSNGMPCDQEEVYKGFDFMLSNWDRLNDFHRNRIMLTDIYKNIEEILPMIRNGHDKTSAAKNDLIRFKQSLS